MENLSDIEEIRKDMIKMWATVISEYDDNLINQANDVMLSMYQTECKYLQEKKLTKLMEDGEKILNEINKNLIPIWKNTFKEFY